MKFTALELFSGIGGWHWALNCWIRKEISHFGFETEVLQAFDINELCNKTYELNFKKAPSSSTIQSLDASYYDKYNSDIWMMSPPCQPFTRNRSSLEENVDENDDRSQPLLSIIEALNSMKNLPKIIFLENVVGFETSKCCNRLLECLKLRGFIVEQYILTPSQFGVPNERPRYYLIAISKAHASNTHKFGCDSIRYSLNEDVEFPSVVSLDSFLDSFSNEEEKEALYLTENMLSKSASWCLDIVTASSNTTSCFTKSYSRFFRGTGSVLFDPLPTSISWGKELSSLISPVSSLTSKDASHQDDESLVSSDSSIELGQKRSWITPSDHKDTKQTHSRSDCARDRNLPQDRTFDPNWKHAFDSKSLRFFSPRELLSIFGFPSEFRFPPSISRKKQYEMIGNSVNIVVLSRLIDHGMKHLTALEEIQTGHQLL